MRKEDKRNLNTKKELANAFKELINYKPINKITINDLIKHCKVNRNTFYYHFKDIYDLINWILNNDFKPIVDELDKDDYTAFLNSTIDYVEKSKHILNSSYNYLEIERIKKILEPHFSEILDIIISKRIQEHNITIDKDFKTFLIDFYSAGIIELIINYSKKNQDIDRKKLVNYLYTLTNIIQFENIE